MRSVFNRGCKRGRWLSRLSGNHGDDDDDEGEVGTRGEEERELRAIERGAPPPARAQAHGTCRMRPHLRHQPAPRLFVKRVCHYVCQAKLLMQLMPRRR